MSKAYTVGRGSTADIKVPKGQDTVGKLHLEVEETDAGKARITDLQSTNGTFVSVGRKWEEVTGTRVVALDADLMLGDYHTTPRKLLAAVSPEAMEKTKPGQPAPDPQPAKRKRSGPRRNEFGEIVLE
ncbi:MAG TPA: FHA domain-containing protein [Chthoniobacter sp.]|jgi:hypothetical protein